MKEIESHCPFFDFKNIVIMTLEPNTYPVQYIEPIQLADNSIIQLRPVHPIDGNQSDIFRKKMSAKSMYDRFLGYIPKNTDKLVKQLTDIDYSREMAIVAVLQDGNPKEIVAVSRIVSDNEGKAEFAIIVADEWHGKGLGKIMTDYMIKIAADMEFEAIYAFVFSENEAMLNILRKRGFELKREDSLTMIASKNLKTVFL